jgi:aminoglycoside phosphotransferase (APT) family kinase protein
LLAPDGRPHRPRRTKLVRRTSYVLEPTEALVAALIADQFPHWAGIPLRILSERGTDNVNFRLGADLAVRMPRIGYAGRHIPKELRWLPVLAPQLPHPVPQPVAAGRPGRGYPWPWYVYRWLEGTTAPGFVLPHSDRLARSLGRWVRALHNVDSRGGPPASAQNGHRGSRLSKRDAFVRWAVDTRAAPADKQELLDVWSASLVTPAWKATSVWIHGDLAPGNVVLDEDDLAAVIDFGCLAVGDPAVDLMVAWNLPEPQRTLFRAEVDVDEETWRRGRGAAFFQWIAAYDPGEPDREATRVIDRILADHRRQRSGG